MLAFFGNTLVFVISGIVIFSKLDLAAFDGRDVGLLILIYVVGTFLRGAIVGATYALLKTLGHKLEWRDSLVATWGGLRGAVGLALAMIVYYDGSICSNIGDKARRRRHPPATPPAATPHANPPCHRLTAPWLGCGLRSSSTPLASACSLSSSTASQCGS